MVSCECIQLVLTERKIQICVIHSYYVMHRDTDLYVFGFLYVCNLWLCENMPFKHPIYTHTLVVLIYSHIPHMCPEQWEEPAGIRR